MTPRDIEREHISRRTAEFLSKGGAVIQHAIGETAIDPITGLTPTRHKQWIASVKSSHKSRLEGAPA